MHSHGKEEKMKENIVDKKAVVTWIGNMRTIISEPRSDATPSCWYRRIMAMIMRNGEDHKP